MTLAALRPHDDVLDIMGNLTYNDGYGAWNNLRLKKEVLTEFPQLKEKTAKLKYKLIFYKSHEELMEAVKKIQENNEPLPILLYFYKE